MSYSPEATKTSTELIIALDFAKCDQAFQLVSTLKDFRGLYKVGLELFLNGGPDFVKELVHQGKRVFLDLKFNDIPNTVAHAAMQAAFLKCELLTIHASSGQKAFEEARVLLENIPDLRPKLLGVTVLTSFDDVHWAQVTEAMTGHTVSSSFSVKGLVQNLNAWKADGVVCSAHELEWVSKEFPSLYTVIPGIRPVGSDLGDQARVMTPKDAARLGADAIVVGRPITRSPDPAKTTALILKELEEAHAD